MELKIIDNKGQDSGTVQLEDKVFESKASKVVLHEAIVALQANQRSGTHVTKTRAQVSGGGIKPWKQKGTGRARAGSTRSPLWRHGGIIFGPVQRSYRQDLPKKKRKLAFKLAVNELITDGRLQVVEPIKLSEPKTKLVASVYKKWSAPNDSLFVVSKIDGAFAKASRNIAGVRVIDAATLNTYDCLRARRVFITKDALGHVTERLKSMESAS